MGVWTNEQTNERMNRRTKERANAQMGFWAKEQTNERMTRRTKAQGRKALRHYGFHPFGRSFVLSSFFRSFIHSFVPSSGRSFVRSFTRSVIHSLGRSFIRIPRGGFPMVGSPWWVPHGGFPMAGSPNEWMARRMTGRMNFVFGIPFLYVRSVAINIVFCVFSVIVGDVLCVCFFFFILDVFQSFRCIFFSIRKSILMIWLTYSQRNINILHMTRLAMRLRLDTGDSTAILQPCEEKNSIIKKQWVDVFIGNKYTLHT